jgi:hypothetical protein
MKPLNCESGRNSPGHHLGRRIIENTWSMPDGRVTCRIVASTGWRITSALRSNIVHVVYLLDESSRRVP